MDHPPPANAGREPSPAIPVEDVAIEIRNVSKRFKLYDDVVLGPLKELLLFWRKGAYHQEFRAVDNVSMQIRRGEVVGIIGPNGSGKTTLLKMIAGLLPIDGGSITVRGRVNALLALGVGVHPEFTGRENIYYSGLLLGMKAAEIESKMDSIVEFSDLGEFIDRPFRTYSSGMKSRLLFSISMSIDPDILIVDEALATGDVYFVQKCGQRIRDLCSRGATILFVSHNLRQIEDICQRVAFMAEGRIIRIGDPQSTIAAYNAWVFEREKTNALHSAPSDSSLQMMRGNGRVRVESVRLKNEAGEIISGIYTGETMHVEIDYVSDLPAGTPVSCFLGVIRDSDGQWVGEISSLYYFDSSAKDVRREDIALWPRGRVTVTLNPVLLLNNQYSFWVFFYGQHQYYCEYRGVAPFFVARRAYVFDRGPVFWQPCRFKNVKISNEHAILKDLRH